MVSRQKSAVILKRDFSSDVKGLYVFGSLSAVKLVLLVFSFTLDLSQNAEKRFLIFSFDLLWGGSLFVMILVRGFH